MKKMIGLVLAMFFGCVRISNAAESVLKPNDSLAICGDSITEQRLYSVYIEDYLLMCQPTPGIQTTQYGWSGDRAKAFLPRMNNDVLRFKPTVATICLGMNDGEYVPLNDANAKTYRDNMIKIVDAFTKHNVRVIVGSPGCVDLHNFNRFGTAPEEYNKTLAAFRDITKEIAAERNLPFADMYDPLHDVMVKAKAKWGQQFPVWDNWGIHPVADGQLVMACAFLKTMGMNGDIGTITVDLSTKKATATDGHAVKSFENGTVTITSDRYPYCFLPDGKDPEDQTPYSIRSTVQLFPFNDELNRFILIVKGASGNLKITWGNESKTFSADRLAKGVNLAAEFMDNPFLDAFEKVDHAVKVQQAYETPMIKDLVHSAYRSALPKEAEMALDRVIQSAAEQDAGASRATAAKAAAPVTHSIKIEPVN